MILVSLALRGGGNLGLWFDFSEIMNDDGEWQPFGVEVKE